MTQNLQPEPLPKIRALEPNEALVLRTINHENSYEQGIDWFSFGLVSAPIWDPNPESKSGLTGLLWGEGKGNYLQWDEVEQWLICIVNETDCIDISGRVKFPQCEVVYIGSEEIAIRLILKYKPSANCVGSSFSSSGYYCESHSSADYSNSATSGNYSISRSFGEQCRSSAIGMNSKSTVIGEYGKSVASGYQCESFSDGDLSTSVSSGHLSRSSACGNRCISIAVGINSYTISNGFGSISVSLDNESKSSANGDLCSSYSNGKYSKSVANGLEGTSFSDGCSSESDAVGIKCVSIAKGFESFSTSSGMDSISISVGERSASYADGENGLAVQLGTYGIAKSGSNGCIALEWYDGLRRRIAIGYVGENGIEADVWYRVDPKGSLIKDNPFDSASVDNENSDLDIFKFWE